MTKDTQIGPYRCTTEQRAQVEALADRYTGGNLTKFVLGVLVGDGTLALTVALDDPTLVYRLTDHCQQRGLDWRDVAREALLLDTNSKDEPQV